MGCTGSKPHLTNHTTNHANSPQKGFIIFNSKTIDYIKAHENELKQKIKEKCEQKLFSNKTLKSKFKKQQLNMNAAVATTPTPVQANDTINTIPGDGNTTTPQLVATAQGDTSSVNQTFLTTSSLCSEKESATLDLAIDLVLKYVMNDFDIENFKTNSNHLSLKQIRKDILKKYSNVSTATTATTALNGTSKSSTLSNSIDQSFYKKALTTAIDEFGAVIQEQFIAINDFQSSGDKKTDSGDNVVVSLNDNHTKDTDNDVKIETAVAVEEASFERAMSLKEALEIARLNFYKGKQSMVCMTKSGSYIVKDAVPVESPKLQDSTKKENVDEVAVHEGKEVKSTQNENIIVTPVLKPKIVTMFDTETKKTSKIAIAPHINIEDVDISATFKIIETSLDADYTKSLNDSTNSSKSNNKKSSSKEVAESVTPKYETVETVKSKVEQNASEVTDNNSNDFFNKQAELEELLRKTTKYSVSYSTNCENLANTDKYNYASELNTYLVNSKNLLNKLKSIAVDDDKSKLIEESFLKSIIDFDYVNKAFMPYMNLLVNDANDSSSSLKDIHIEIKINSEDINNLIINLPENLFKQKNLPSPKEMHGHNIINSTPTTVTPIDLKKEIAISILNVGEVLAKTIDYYSIDQPQKLIANQSVPSVVTSVSAITEVKSDVTDSVNDKQQLEQEKEQPVVNASEILSPPPPPSPSINETPASSSIEFDKLANVNINNQNQDQNESTSISSPTDLLSSMSSSSAMSSPGKLDEPLKNFKDENNPPFELDTKIDSMSYLIREMEHTIGTNLDSYADEINDAIANGVNSVNVTTEKYEIVSNGQPIKEFVSTVIETATNKVNDEDETVHHEVTKRLSINEELLNQLQEVDKRVKYLSETCSEDDDDDHNDVNANNNFDNEKLFNPTRSNRINVDNNDQLYKDVKQISGFIEDLFQTFKKNEDDEDCINTTSSITTNTVTKTVSANGGIDPISTTISKTIVADVHVTNNGENGNHEIELKSSNGAKTNGNHRSDRKSTSSIGGNSSIPIRAKVLTKQKATAIEDENANNNNNNNLDTSLNNDDTTNESLLNDSNIDNRKSLDLNNTPDILNTSNGKGNKKFRSKLPVKK